MSANSRSVAATRAGAVCTSRSSRRAPGRSRSSQISISARTAAHRPGRALRPLGGADHDVDAPVLGAPLGVAVGLERVLLAVGEDADAAFREVDRRFRLPPLLHRYGRL